MASEDAYKHGHWFVKFIVKYNYISLLFLQIPFIFYFSIAVYVKLWTQKVQILMPSWGVLHLQVCTCLYMYVWFYIKMMYRAQSCLCLWTVHSSFPLHFSPIFTYFHFHYWFRRKYFFHNVPHCSLMLNFGPPLWEPSWILNGHKNHKIHRGSCKNSLEHSKFILTFGFSEEDFFFISDNQNPLLSLVAILNIWSTKTKTSMEIHKNVYATIQWPSFKSSLVPIGQLISENRTEMWQIYTADIDHDGHQFLYTCIRDHTLYAVWHIEYMFIITS